MFVPVSTHANISHLTDTCFTIDSLLDIDEWKMNIIEYHISSFSRVQRVRESLEKITVSNTDSYMTFPGGYFIF